MKHLLIVVFVLLGALFLSSFAQASGKLIYQPTYFLGSETVKPVYGLSVYERIVKDKLYLNAYLGRGEMPFEEYGIKGEGTNVEWNTAKVALDLVLFNWKVILSPGFQYNYSKPSGNEIRSYNLKITYQIW